MRLVFVGICQAAMVKLYQVEKDRLNLYWEDVNNNVNPPRQTRLGNFVLCLLQLLPTLRQYTANL